jgi:hypothetical protein
VHLKLTPMRRNCRPFNITTAIFYRTAFSQKFFRQALTSLKKAALGGLEPVSEPSPKSWEGPRQRLDRTCLNGNSKLMLQHECVGRRLAASVIVEEDQRPSEIQADYLRLFLIFESFL